MVEKNDKAPSKADQKAARKSPRSSKERAEAAEQGKDSKRSYASLQQEGYRRGRSGR